MWGPTIIYLTFKIFIVISSNKNFKGKVNDSRPPHREFRPEILQAKQAGLK
jgi:hypothetical protein